MNRIRVLQGLVFVPSAVFVNDILIGFNEVTGDTQLHRPATATQKSLVLVNRMSDKLHGGTLERGDLVVINDPYDPKRNLVRRVVRSGKDWVRVQDGDSEYHVYVKDGYCWVEGRGGASSEPPSQEENSQDEQVYDSKTFGPISQGLILGLPILVSWPLSRFGFFPISSSPSPTSDETAGRSSSD